MNASTRAVAANFFQCAEHEVEEKLRILKQLLDGSGSNQAPAGPSQADFDELKSRVGQLEATIRDLTTPEIPDQPASDGTGNASGTVSQS